VELGAVGLQTVHAGALDTAIRHVQASVNSTTRPAVLIPTAWVRTFLIEGTDLPRRRTDLDDVLRWRLKKLLPVPPSDLRLATAMQPADGDRRQILCTAVREKPLAVIEEAFRGVKLRPGMIVPRILALALMGEGDHLVVEQDHDVVAFAVVASGGVRLVRTKPLPAARDAWPDLRRELTLALDFARDTLGITDQLEARITAADPDVQQLLGRQIEDLDGLRPVPSTAGAVCPDAVLAQHLGPIRLHAMAAVFAEGHPR
jgi:hypothetical protein